MRPLLASGVRLYVLFGLIVIASVAAPARADMKSSITKEIPTEVASAMVGCWEVGYGFDYRVVLRRDGGGMRAKQHATAGRRAHDLDEPVFFEPSETVFGFLAIGGIHRAMILLWLRDGKVSWSFSSKIGGKWDEHVFEPARRCRA